MPAKDNRDTDHSNSLSKSQVLLFVLDTTRNHIRYASDTSIENNGISLGPVRSPTQLYSHRRTFIAWDLTYRTSRHSFVLSSVYILFIFILSLSFLFFPHLTDLGAFVHPLP
ncbi:hypothetical protein FPOAC2_11648 [Fusarium poae]